MQTLFERISVAALSGELLEKVTETRPNCSRNTINLALKDERPREQRTPLRNYIRQIAEQLLSEKTINREEPAPA